MTKNTHELRITLNDDDYYIFKTMAKAYRLSNTQLVVNMLKRSKFPKIIYEDSKEYAKLSNYFRELSFELNQIFQNNKEMNSILNDSLLNSQDSSNLSKLLYKHGEFTKEESQQLMKLSNELESLKRQVLSKFKLM